MSCSLWREPAFMLATMRQCQYFWCSPFDSKQGRTHKTHYTSRKSKGKFHIKLLAFILALLLFDRRFLRLYIMGSKFVVLGNPFDEIRTQVQFFLANIPLAVTLSIKHFKNSCFITSVFLLSISEGKQHQICPQKSIFIPLYHQVCHFMGS